MVTIRHVHDVFFHSDPVETEQLQRIEDRLDYLIEGAASMSAAIDRLVSEVTETKGAYASMKAFIEGKVAAEEQLAAAVAAAVLKADTLEAAADAAEALVMEQAQALSDATDAALSSIQNNPAPGDPTPPVEPPAEPANP